MIGTGAVLASFTLQQTHRLMSISNRPMVAAAVAAAGSRGGCGGRGAGYRWSAWGSRARWTPPKSRRGGDDVGRGGSVENESASSAVNLNVFICTKFVERVSVWNRLPVWICNMVRVVGIKQPGMMGDESLCVFDPLCACTLRRVLVP